MMGPGGSARGTMMAVAAIAGLAGASIASARDRIAFVDATVLPMTSVERLEHQTVIVDNGRILRIGAASKVRVPRGAVRIDAHGRFLMPGLSDMHVHLEADLSKPEAEARKPAAVLRVLLLSYLATGVTRIRSMSGSPTQLRWREAIAQGTEAGPRMTVCSPIIEGVQPVWGASTLLIDPARAEAIVAGFARSGYDCIKAYHTLSAPAYHALAAAAQRHALPLVGHIPFDIGIDGALAERQATIEHLRGYDFDRVPRSTLEKEGGRSAERFSSWIRMDPARSAELVRRTVAAGSWNVPTLSLNLFLASPEKRRSLVSDPRFSLLTPDMRAGVVSNQMDAIFGEDARAAMRSALPYQAAFVRALDTAGAKLLIGTDSSVGVIVPGFTAIDEMQHFVDAGIPIARVLRIATVDAAHAPGCRGDASIEPGKRTDMILLDADPYADIANLWRLSGVIAHGRWHTRDALFHTIARLDDQLEGR